MALLMSSCPQLLEGFRLDKCCRVTALLIVLNLKLNDFFEPTSLPTPIPHPLSQPSRVACRFLKARFYINQQYICIYFLAPMG